MNSISRLHIFLENFLNTKNIIWLELFIFEYQQHKERSKTIPTDTQRNANFVALPFYMSHNLLRLLFSTICDLISIDNSVDNSQNDEKVLCLRNFLTSGIGSRIIVILTMMSTDLDLSNLTNERELVSVLTRVFPTERWEDETVEQLTPLSRKDVKELYKNLRLLNPSSDGLKPLTLTEGFKSFDRSFTEIDAGNLEEFLTEEFQHRPEIMKMKSCQLAQRILQILMKLVESESASALGQTDQNSVTMICLNFSFDMLHHLNDKFVFNESDQTVIRLNLMSLMFMCFNSLIIRDGKSIEPSFKKMFQLLEICDHPEISCGLVLAILTVVGNLCIKRSLQRIENLKLFILCNHLLLKVMDVISRETDLLMKIQCLLTRIIRNINASQQIENNKKMSKKRRRKISQLDSHHHNDKSDACSFERLLIDSLPLIKSNDNLARIIKYFPVNGICCCNANVETIRIFLNISVTRIECFSFIKKVLVLIFKKSQPCDLCNEKLNSYGFRDEYFYLVTCETNKRRGQEDLDVILHHLYKLLDTFPSEFINKLIFEIVCPCFAKQMKIFQSDPVNEKNSKSAINICLQIIIECIKDEDVITKFYNDRIIQHLKDISLIPSMAGNVCQLFKIAIENAKLIGEMHHRDAMVFTIKQVLFSNMMYLIHELVEIYTNIGLPRHVSLDDSIEFIDENTGFEILDETATTINEELSHQDILLLNTFYWNIICDLIASDSSFQIEFVESIYNNFNGNILFTIAYNALNSILLKKDVKETPKRVVSPEPPLNQTTQPKYDVLESRLTYSTIISMNHSEMNFEQIMERYYQFYERNTNFVDTLYAPDDDDDVPCVLYKLQHDKDIKFRTLVHRDNFLRDYIDDDDEQTKITQHEDPSRDTLYHRLLDNIRVVIVQTKVFEDRFAKLISRFIRQDQELKQLYRQSVLKEITSSCGIKYLSSIARNCFDICWRLSDNISFSTKMSTALEELKLLMLQDSWNENKQAMMDTLQLLLGVAEMKTTYISRMTIMDPDTHLIRSSKESILSDLDSSDEQIRFDDKSDDEKSSDNKTEIYWTADENYDADEEYYSTHANDTSCCQSIRTSSFPAVMGYRNTNEHICKLVIEILMELSKKCVEQTNIWEPNVLLSLAQRLSCMRAFLGGSEFLLKGFSAILTANETHLTDLQSSILQLVEDLNTPESFKSFLSILTSEKPAITQMINRLEQLCNAQQTPCPFVKVNYPIFNESPEVTTASECDKHHQEIIQNLRNIHLENKLLTSFTESSQIIPLNFLDFQPWNHDGMSLCLWINLDQIDAEDDKMPSHLISIGSEKMLLAIHIIPNGAFTLSISKPNRNLSDVKRKKKFDGASTSNRQSSFKSSNKENANKSNLFGIAVATMKTPEVPNIRTRSFPKNGFSQSMSIDSERSRKMDTTKIIIRSKKSRLKSNQWHHVCFSVKKANDEIVVLITINGTDQEFLEIPIEGMCEPEVNGKLQVLCLGCQRSARDEAISVKYSISNVILFKEPLDSNLVAHLYTLGPDCDSLIDCEAVPLLGLLGSLDLSKVNTKSKKYVNIGSPEHLLKLKSNTILTCSAARPSIAIGYKNVDQGIILRMFIVGKFPEPLIVPSLYRSIAFSGGMSTLLFLFARTVELTDDPWIQSSSLYILLKMAFTSNQLYTEFHQKKLFHLVAHVFMHSNCHRGPEMLRAILDVVYDGTMFSRRTRNGSYHINEHTSLNIKNPKLLLILLENFNIFMSPDHDEIEILDFLFKSLMAVVRDHHPHKNLNRQCLIDWNFYEKLIEFCKIHLSNSSNTVNLTISTALAIVELIRMLAPQPPTMWTINEIQKLLLLLHHPKESFVTHDRSRFHFILSTNRPPKQSKINIASLNSKYFNFSTKIRATSSKTTSPRSPVSSPRRFKTTSTSKTPIKKLKARKLDDLLENESQLIEKSFVNHKIMKDFKKNIRTPKRVHVRRLTSTPVKSLIVKENRSKKWHLRKTKKVTDDPLDSETIERFDELLNAGSSSSAFVDLDRISRDDDRNGINVLQENLFYILRSSILLLDDVQANAQLPECFKIEMFIMFANHPDANVRTAIIELIQVAIGRLPLELVQRYQKLNYWIHLGNQLSLSPVNIRMIQSCVDWICFDKIIVTDLHRAQKLNIKYKPALGPLILMLPSMVHDEHLINFATKFLRLILETQPDCFTPMLDHGLISSCVKALTKLDESNERAKDSISMVLEQIAIKILTSSGSIQVLWDLLYGLSFVERQKKHEVVRSVHLSILQQLLSSCLTETNRRHSRTGETRQLITVTQSLATLPPAEIKTRFNMIHDRSVQFVTSWETTDDLMECEVEFSKYLINLHFSGFHHGTSLILWAMNPLCDDEIKLYVIQKMSAALAHDATYTVPGCDPKMFKSLAQTFLQSNSTMIDPELHKTMDSFCGLSSSQQQQNWNWKETAIEKIEVTKQTAQRDQNLHVDKVIYKLESVVQQCIDGAMRMTRDVMDIQNKERRQLMNQLKKTQEIDFYREWSELIQRMIHEDGPWYNSQLCPSTWELDETEGPGRCRIRLKRATLNIEERFFLEEFQQKASYQYRTPLLNYLLHPAETENYPIQDRIIYTFNGKHLTLEQEIEGEIIITDSRLIFRANKDTYNRSIICNITDIEELWDRRFQHKEVAMEIFLRSRRTFFIIFETNYDRDIVRKLFSDKIEKNLVRTEDIAQRWTEGKITNFEYLMQLNKIAGRNYNDLMQYPVFPWIIANYESDVLDLTLNGTFRKLSKTISTQHDEMEEHYINNYQYLQQSVNENPHTVMKPYHYSSHYSNSGTVLHFLVRLPPFTNMFLLYQDHNFDIPDRTFHSLATTYKLASKESATDVKELIPEFFYLSDFLENSEGFNFGKRQTGDLVDNVYLPKWCNGSSRLFMLIHRQALECDMVRKHLHQWIDLIFGFKQKGNPAIDAINVFHPATYPEFQITNIIDTVERSAYETMIRTYGQMPKQIFSSPHKKANIYNEKLTAGKSVLSTVKGLRWGLITGSPQLTKPKRIFALKCDDVKLARLVTDTENNIFYGMPAKSHLMAGNQRNNIDSVLWGESDGIIRVKLVKENNAENAKRLFHVPSADPVTSCASHLNYSILWFGHRSGNINVYQRIDEIIPAPQTNIKNQRSFNTTLESIIGIQESATMSSNKLAEIVQVKSKWNYPILLVKHKNPISDIKISMEFRIVVSIDSDGRTVIWDAQKIEYIRTIEPAGNTFNAQLSHVAISSTLGDILTVFCPKGTVQEEESEADEDNYEVMENSTDDFINVSISIAGKSQLRLHSINAKYIGHAFIEGIVTAVAFSYVKEGSGVNLMAIGMQDGTIKLLSTWNLELIREITTGFDCEITELAYTSNQHLACIVSNEIHVWESEGLPGPPPKFNKIVFRS